MNSESCLPDYPTVKNNSNEAWKCSVTRKKCFERPHTAEFRRQRLGTTPSTRTGNCFGAKHRRLLLWSVRENHIRVLQRSAFGSTDKLWLSRISFFGTDYGRENGEKFTPSGQKVPTLHSASFKWRDTCSKNWKQKWWMYGCTRIFPIKKEIKLKPTTIGNRLCVRLLEVINNTWENLSHNGCLVSTTNLFQQKLDFILIQWYTQWSWWIFPL